MPDSRWDGREISSKVTGISRNAFWFTRLFLFIGESAFAFHENPGGIPGLSIDSIAEVNRLNFKIGGMVCENCVKNIEDSVAKIREFIEPP